MAKKKAAGEFNMSQEIRNVLGENPQIKGKDLYETLVKRFPKAKINKASCLVAFSNARKKLGLSKGGATTKRVARKRGAASGEVGLEALQAAADFVSKVGDEETAINAVRQLKHLQIR